MMLADSEIIAIRRADDMGGRAAAMAELRRRFMALTDANAPAILDRILAMPVAQPPTIVGHKGPRRDPPGLVRKNRSRP